MVNYISERVVQPGADGEVLTTNGGVAGWAAAPAGSGGGVQSIVPGTGIAVDNTDPQNPVVSATGGGGGGGATPTIVGISAAYTSTSSVTVAYPAGIQAGDIMLLFTAHAWNPTPPAGWTVVDQIDASFVNCLTVGKTVAASDVGGSVTVSYSGGSPGGEVAIVAVRGAVKINGVASKQATSGGSITTSVPGGRNDLALLWCGCRAVTTLTASQGTLQERRNTDSGFAQALYSETVADIFAGTVTWTSSTGSSSGFYAASVAISG